MGFELRSGLSFCEVSGRILFLDLVEDRYFCLQPRAEGSFRTLLSRSDLALEDRPALAGMLRSGLLIERQGSTSTLCPFRAPHGSLHTATESLLDTPHQHGALAPLIHAMVQLMNTRLTLRLSPLHVILRKLALAKPGPRPIGSGDAETLQTAATAFELTSRFVRSHDKCLSRSIALSRHLAARDVPAQLMIGVKLRPFEAHAWVQSGRWLVNDRIDTVRNYTPILSL